MYIGKIVSSNSHIDYICQVFGPGEEDPSPLPQDYGFGVFVRIAGEGERDLIGIIYDTTLRNPEFGNLGPRLSPQEDLAVFSPDYLAEKAILVAIAVLGEMDPSGQAEQRIPVAAAPIDAYVERLDREGLLAFHRQGGRLQVGYLPLLARMNHPLATFLMQSIMDQLGQLFPESHQRLSVLAGNLAWKSRVEPIG
jgi:hypothetical protein